MNSYKACLLTCVVKREGVFNNCPSIAVCLRGAATCLLMSSVPANGGVIRADGCSPVCVARETLLVVSVGVDFSTGRVKTFVSC